MKSAQGGSAQAEAIDTPDSSDRAAFGEFLRQARERRHLTLQQIANETKISSRHLTALEQGNVKSLPGGMYRRAMLRAYAESVGLDRDAALAQFERTFEPRVRAAAPRAGAVATRTTAVVEPDAPAAPVSERARDVRVPLIGVVIAATLIVALVTGDGNQSRETVTAQETPTSHAVTPAATRRAQTATAGPARIVAASGGAAPVSTPAPTPLRTARAAPTTATPARVPSSPTPASSVRARTERGSDAVTATTGGADAAAQSRPGPVRATSGEITIVTAPTGARVTIDGTGWGTTPVTVRHLPFGSKRIRVTSDGYLSQERAVSVSAARPAVTTRITLAPRE